MAASKRSVVICPGEAELRRFHARELTAAEQSRVERHVEQCPACADRAAALLAEHNSWVERLRAARPILQDLATKQSQPDVMPGSLHIAGYDVRDEIRRGGQGIVFRALQESTKREVAIKILREGPGATDAVRKRFEREIELAAALNHPHIVTVFDSSETADGNKYFVMDYVRGQPLDRYLATRSSSLVDRVALHSTICKAVNYAHQRGVIHRDLKPPNILVDDEGNPHILDFGLARQTTTADTAPMTTTGHVAGTLPYMSPEQARGLPDAVDVRSDVYSLGVILYELLTGRYPYPVQGDTIQVLKHIAETPPARPSRPGRLPSDDGTTDPALETPPTSSLVIDDEVETIVLKALSKERERRYQSAGELARDLDHYLAGKPIEAKRDSGWYVLKKTLRRYRVGVAVVAAFILLITVSAVSLGVMYWAQSQARAEAERQANVARERLHQVRQIANTLMLGVDPRISHLPGAAPARRFVVEAGLNFLGILARESADDPRIQQELAVAYITIGDVQGSPQTSNLGDLHGALESYRKAQDILADVAAANPQNLPLQHTLLVSHLKIGDVVGKLGNRDAALASYRHALETCQRLRRASGKDVVIDSHLASAHERVGGTLKDLGQVKRALEHLHESARINGELAKDAPQQLEPRQGLATVHAHIGQIHYSQGRLAEALKAYRECLAIGLRLLDAHPDHIVMRSQVGVAHQWVGIILADMGQAEPAIQSFMQSIAVFEDLTHDNPQDVESQNLLATNYSKLGEIHLAAGRVEQAQATFERVVELSELLARDQPDRADIVRNQGVAYYKMAELNRARADDDSRPRAERMEHCRLACDWLRKSHKVFVHMHERSILAPSDVGVPDELARELTACQAALLALESD